MDRIAETKTERVIEALAKLGDPAGPSSPELSIPHNLLPEQAVIGREDLYQHKRGREIVKPQKIRREAPDPAFLAYRAALDAYRGRTAITAAKMAATATELAVVMLQRYVKVFEKLQPIALESGHPVSTLVSPSFSAVEMAIRLYERDTTNDVVLRRIRLTGAPGNRSVHVPPWHGIDSEGAGSS